MAIKRFMCVHVCVSFVKQHWNSRHMTSTSSFEARLAEADAYLKLLIDQAKVSANSLA